MNRNRIHPSTAWLCAFLAFASVACDQPADRGANEWREPVSFSVEGAVDAEGFCAVTGTAGAPAGSRVLITVEASPGRGTGLAERALATVADDGSFAHRTLLAYPLSYGIRAEISRAANPDRAAMFGEVIEKAALAEGVLRQRDADGSWKLSATAEIRIGTMDDEKTTIAAALDALDERVKRLAYDRKQLAAIAGASAGRAPSMYLTWARIRGEKARSLGLDEPDLSPLYSRLDRRTRELWTATDRAALWHLAKALGDEKEMANTESGVRMVDRELPKLIDEIAALRKANR